MEKNKQWFWNPRLMSLFKGVSEYYILVAQAGTADIHMLFYLDSQAFSDKI